MKHIFSKLVATTGRCRKTLIFALLAVTVIAAHALTDPIGCVSRKESRHLQNITAKQPFVVYQQSCNQGEENTIVLQPVSGESAVHIKGFRFATQRGWIKTSSASHLNLFADDATTGLLLSLSNDGRVRRMYLGRDPIWGYDKTGQVAFVVTSTSLSSELMAPLISRLGPVLNKAHLNSYVQKGINGIHFAATPTSDGTFEIAKGTTAERLLMPILRSALLATFTPTGERGDSIDRLSSAIFFKLHLLQFEHGPTSDELWMKAIERIGLKPSEIEWVEGSSDLLFVIVEQQRKEMNHDN